MLLTNIYQDSALCEKIAKGIEKESARIHINGLKGSMSAILAAALDRRTGGIRQLLIANNREDAFYLLNDIETLLEEQDNEMEKKRVMLFPTSGRTAYSQPNDDNCTDNANVLMRSEVVKRLGTSTPIIVVTFPEALSERVVSMRTLNQRSLTIVRGSKIDIDNFIDLMQDYQFDRVDFVVEPGQYALRGGIIDIFSFAGENPFRIELFDDTVESLRTFDPASQLSIHPCDNITILPNLDSNEMQPEYIEERVPLTDYFDSTDTVWVQSLIYTCDILDKLYAKAEEGYNAAVEQRSPHAPEVLAPLKPDSKCCDSRTTLKSLLRCRLIETGNSQYFSNAMLIEAHCESQPVFNKQFDMLAENLNQYAENGYRLLIATSNESQQRRLTKIFNSDEYIVGGQHIDEKKSLLNTTLCSLRSGFIDHDAKLLCYTDHQIFERYHKYTVRDMHQTRESLTLKELFELKPGDYVTHIDFGVGRFSGLEKVTTNGRTQEVIRLLYKDNDTLYISIHGLHKISRYVGKEGTTPTLNRLGSGAWQALKQRTKKHVKDIAKDLIALYAKRKASKGFAFSADSYLQNELEASFIYEDTPDQLKATIDVKQDMESAAPMDRLVCGDVGFGKTEVAIRAAFKAVCDSKQVAVLVPSTVLAFQHYNTFAERLKGLPVNIDYLNRFRSTKEKTQIYKKVAEGKIDILIGTHAITNKNLKFKDLGLLIVDEEQKFGVSVKERLRQMKVNVDSLTLTATPIPRTLQFSLMGARDLSVIRTAPPNRQPIQTELCNFSESVIRDAIAYEISRGGQTFFISNRIENLPEMASLVQRLVPDARVSIAHGQMDGKEVERRIMRFLEGDLDVLVATSIVENGLDMPNANTMIINNAHQFGLSELHQIRGRVGRSNKKAFCYMMVPSFDVLTPDARKRMQAIEEFSTIGSGFNIAMRDLDIRGAGNILGAEQSGFVNEMGYDTYHKILNEAIEELKETEFSDLFHDEKIKQRNFVKECSIETDLAVMLPDEYVTSISERLLLYKELNDLETDQQLADYRARLVDRFGPIPTETDELINTIKLRRMAKTFGIERLVLKLDRMSCFFPANTDNPFYDSGNFTKMINYVNNHPANTRLKQNDNHLSLVISPITSIAQAVAVINDMM